MLLTNVLFTAVEPFTKSLGKNASQKTPGKNPIGRGQASIEAMLIWIALASSIALFTPAFAHAMDAYTLHVNVNQFTQFGNELEKTIHTLSFAGNGSQTRIRVPLIKNMEVSVENNDITLQLSHDELSLSKTKIIHSTIILEGSITSGKTIRLTRKTGKITIQDE
jgi:hypothetical protein